MAERPAKKVKKKLATEVTDALISYEQKLAEPANSKEKYKKLIVWDNYMKEILEREADKRGISVTAFIKFCVAKEIKNYES